MIQIVFGTINMDGLSCMQAPMPPICCRVLGQLEFQSPILLNISPRIPSNFEFSKYE